MTPPQARRTIRSATRSANPVTTAVRKRPSGTALLLVVLAAYLMIIVDNSIVITGLPQVQRDLGFSAASLSWVQNAYTLTFGGLLLLGARAGDVFGRRRVFVVGLAIFTLASLGVGTAQNEAWLVAARAVQGVGSAILAPSTLALLTAGFPAGRARARAVAAYGSVAGIGAAVGLVAGGLVADRLSWRWGFFINLPIGLALVWGAWRTVAPVPGRREVLDVRGAVASTAGMALLVHGIVRAAEAGWADPVTLGSVLAGLACLAALVLIERRAVAPIMPLRLFRSRERVGAYLARLLFIGAMISFFLFLSQYLQGVLGWTPFQAGAAFLPMTVVNFAVAVTVPKLTRRFGNHVLLAVGVAVTAAGMAWLSRLSGESYLAGMFGPLLLVGIGQGLAFAPLTSAGIAGVAPEDAGAASGMVNAAHQLGGALGFSSLVAVAAAAQTGGTQAAQLASRVTAALTGGAVMLAAALVVTVVFIVRGAASRQRISATSSSTSDNVSSRLMVSASRSARS